ncbi:hypothetical protein BH23GEM9_BH23GEM9_15790 [soil metagenome]
MEHTIDASRQAETPVDLAARLFDALHRQDWIAAAALVDEAGTGQWYRGRLQQWQPAWQPRAGDVLQQAGDVLQQAGDVLQQPADAVTSLAPHQIDELQRGRELFAGIGSEFAGISTHEELAGLSPQVALARFLQAADPAPGFEALFSLFRNSSAGPPLQCPEPPVRRRSVIGLLRQDGDTAYVAYRAYWSDGPPEDAADELKVAALRLTPAGWRFRLLGEIFERAGFTVIAERATEVEA